MSRPRKLNPKAIYIKPSTRDMLESSWNYPLTFISAPAGYGKTTLLNTLNGRNDTFAILAAPGREGLINVRHAIRNLIREYFDTSEFRSVEAKHTENMTLEETMKYIILNVHNVFLHSKKNGRRLCIAIDDIHLIENEAYVRFLYSVALKSHGMLNFVFTSRISYWSRISPEVIEGSINLIDSSQLCLNRMELLEYLKRSGIEAIESDADWLYERTGGWMLLCHSSMVAYLHTGRMGVNFDIRPYFRQIIDEMLDKSELELVLLLSCINGFTVDSLTDLLEGLSRLDDGGKASVLTGKMKKAERFVVCGETLSGLIRKNMFLTYDLEENEYTLNSVFGRYMMGKLEEHWNLSVATVQEVYGGVCEKAGDFAGAAWYYWNTGLYDQMLGAIEESNRTELIWGRIGRAERYYRDCPKEIRLRHPFALLMLAWRFYYYGRNDLFLDASAEFKESLTEESGLTEEERNSLLCDYYIFSIMTTYNNLELCIENSNMAIKYFDGNVRTDHAFIPQTFGALSLMGLIFNRGTLDDIIRNLDVVVGNALKLTGKWYGKGFVAKAEAAYLRLDYSEARRLAEAGLRECSENHYDEPGIMIQISTLMIRLALATGDFDGFNTGVRWLRQPVYKTERYNRLEPSMQASMAWLYAQADCLKSIPSWIINGNLNETTLFTPAIPSVLIVRLLILLKQEKYYKVLSYIDSFLGSQAITDNLVIREEAMMLFSCAYAGLGKIQEARDMLAGAIELAHVTGNQATILEYGEPVIHLLPSIDKKYKKNYELAKPYFRRYRETLNRVYELINEQERAGLTKREYELAEYAASGRTNREIAEALSISENTVKSTLKRVFAKTDVSSRRQLKEYLSQWSGE